MQSATTRTALSATQIIATLAKAEGWKLHGDGADVAIEKTYKFENFLKTMAFVNAVAYVAEQQDHHPELLLTYGSCSVRFNTHDVQGVSRSDFECAALVDALYAPTSPSA
ncbi:4a-hydroxytetrahydrobiopterin dehydratase [Rhodoferax sp.]|uniref:4a-hydroxytetrahydrobiopterin dehydratase n=1 Tax=Rhodoferax sp. TaxID=50421 RepID=UPI0025EAED63|nr:4a-hydroxytetrahydrobiopterin dehydratase [Rhodoferax sp.]